MSERRGYGRSGRERSRSRSREYRRTERDYRDREYERYDRDTRDTRDSRDSRDSRDTRDTRDSRDTKTHDTSPKKHGISTKHYERNGRTGGPDHRKTSTKYDPLTTESLHARKLSALNHEAFLINRQKERDAAVLDGKWNEMLWPRTPERSQFYFGECEGEEDENTLDIEASNEETVNEEPVSVSVIAPVALTNDMSDSEEFNPIIRVKAPSASKPSINSFSTSKPAKYGNDLMPGEGTAMAGFVASGQRIPRRGEIGLESAEITRFESAGYVMSGSRHHLMNAVRMRKENQVISAEEKRMISQMAIEERIKREEEIVKTFKSMVDEKLKEKQNK